MQAGGFGGLDEFGLGVAFGGPVGGFVQTHGDLQRALGLAQPPARRCVPARPVPRGRGSRYAAAKARSIRAKVGRFA